MNKIYQLLLIFSVVCSLGFAEKPNLKEGDTQKINSKNFNNLYKVNENIYRSEQPTRKGMSELDGLGIKTIVNLRNRLNDKHKVKNTGLNLIHYPINTWKFSYSDLVKTLIILGTVKKPILIHCLHGSDRTGAMVAAYRMVFENWSKEAAIKEFKEVKYGYHEKWFPKILNVLQAIDVEDLKHHVHDNK